MAEPGPLDCLDDHVEKSYFDDAKVRKVISSFNLHFLLSKVREALHVASYTKIGGWSLCSIKIHNHYNWSTASLLTIYPTLM